MLELFDQSLSVIILHANYSTDQKYPMQPLLIQNFTMLAQLPLMKPLWNKQIWCETKK